MEESVHEPVSVNRTTGITPELPPTTAEAPAPEDAAQTPEVAAVSFADGATVDLRRGSTEPDAKKAEWPRPVSGQIGPCELLEELRPGGMGRVFKARHARLGHVVVVKIIRTEAGEDRGRSVRFYREAKAVASLRHPNVITLHDYGEDDGRRYFTMEYAAGGSLAEQRARYQADPRAAAALMEKIARAVHHAHERGIFHRDLKPGNILIDERDEPLISDFGLAKFTGTNAELTRPGEMLGTTAYMPPEQAAGRAHEAKATNDVWSLGVMLYELLTGRRPFVGKDNEEIRQRVLRNEPPRPRSLRRGLDWALEVVTLKCLETDPTKRYQSATELADELARWLRGEPIRTKSEPWPRRAWRTLRRYGLIVAISSLGGGMAAVLAVSYLSDPERSREADTRALRRGRKVVFIDDEGRTVRRKSMRWPEFPGIEPIGAANQEQLFQYGAYDLSLAELTSDPGLDQYRLSAEILTREMGFDGEAGLYVGYRNLPGGASTLFALTFNGAVSKATMVPPRAVDDRWEFGFRVHRKAPGGTLDRAGISSDLLDPRGTAFQNRWRTLALEVRRSGLTASWDGKKAAPMPATHLALDAEALLRILPHVQEKRVEFTPRSGLGLYVLHGVASFRRVVLEPLADE